MDTNLGKFEGRAVQVGVANVNGKIDEAVGKLSEGEFAFVFAKVKVNTIKFGDVKKGKATLFARIHDMSTTRMVLLDEDHGARLLEEAIEMADETFGIQSLLTSVVDATGDEGEGNADNS